MIPSSDKSDGFVFGHYYLEKRLAHGGMAEVFLGRDLELPEDGARCVVKCILPDLASDPQFLAMFLNEAQLAAQMNHPNIVKVLDFGENDGLLYMAMEYVEGLDCWRFNRRAFPFGKDHTAIAVFIIQNLLSGLSYVHQMTDVNGVPLNVVHRDLSPSNVYLSVAGAVKLGDFGIAHIDSPRYRQISYVPRGKFGYVSPEQIEGTTIDGRSDIFSAAIILAELLLGKKLFKGPSQLSVLLEIRDGRFDTLVNNQDRIEPRLLEILYRALARKPEERFSTAIEFRDHLTRYLSTRAPKADDLAKQVRRAVEIEKDKASIHGSLLPAATEDDETTPMTLISRPPAPAEMPTDPSRSMTPSFWASEGDWDELNLDGETPVTSDFNPTEKEWFYRLKISEDQTTGPMSFATMMELLCQDQIVPETRVSLNDGPFKPAQQYPELARHLLDYTPTLDVNGVQSPNRRGVLTVEAPAEVVLSLAIADDSGLLVCKQDTKRKEVYLKRGKPVYVSSNEPSELLGEYLAGKGIIERAELDMALDVLPKFDGHMGDTLIALGMISAVDLFRNLGNQLKDRLKDLLTWRQGVYEFYRDFSCRQNALEIPIDPYTFVVDCLVSDAKSLAVQEVFTSMRHCVVDRTPAAPDILRRLTLPAPIDSIVHKVTEPIDFQSLAVAADDDRKQETLISALYVALETGIWVMEGSSPPWR